MLKIIKSGLYTTIQDLGRYGFRAYGVPVSGAMDQYAFHKANYLLGNKRNDAAVEIFYGGVQVEALQDTWLTLTGAEVYPEIEGHPIDMWSPILLEKGQHLICSSPKNGVVSYLAIDGGIDSPKYLNSRSTYEKAGFGKRLKNGDIIESFKIHNDSFRSIQQRKIPTYTHDIEVRVIPGPHERLFNDTSIKQFYRQSFVVIKGDRMGARLEGSSSLRLNKFNDILSEAVTFGTIQIPHNGQPTVLLADAQTTGGYPIIGTIHTEDLWRFVQIPLGGTVKFKRWKVE
ncbi:biotin-dependent carboxyltransferase family protein [Piscibacillus halophilus]|uniref:Antagonist of KipI n=1 Tax=Piscibacillus halophilus TaxID=571933 RepID=A0A1H9BAK5_9BACI|nr:biotin-dependent carboxyltransferase family protein [Piscibacillus halophilus]SEP85767.1 antagonist of KipI [Piscibacillus halophilus]